MTFKQLKIIVAHAKLNKIRDDDRFVIRVSDRFPTTLSTHSHSYIVSPHDSTVDAVAEIRELLDHE